MLLISIQWLEAYEKKIVHGSQLQQFTFLQVFFTFYHFFFSPFPRLRLQSSTLTLKLCYESLIPKIECKQNRKRRKLVFSSQQAQDENC
jgi:hypothetical protein